MLEEGRANFPFAALVDQEELKTALILNAINPGIGGLLIKGPKGTGKSTVVYSFVDLLPPLSVVSGCPFCCNPQDPTNMCQNCRRRFSYGERLPTEERRMKVVNLPLGTTEDRLIGSINVEKILKEGVKALQPGILALANQNILYVDEINLLPDHITDDILDAAASGWNSIEREGVSVSHPSRFILVGTMNPEEGELRPQILDRMALSVEVPNLRDEEERTAVIKRNILFEADPYSFISSYSQEQEDLREGIAKAKDTLKKVTISEEMLKAISSACIKLEVDGLRPDIIITKASLTLASFQGKKKVEREHLLKAAYLTLGHRTRKGGFEQPATKEEIKKAFEISFLGPKRGGKVYALSNLVTKHREERRREETYEKSERTLPPKKKETNLFREIPQFITGAPVRAVLPHLHTPIVSAQKVLDSLKNFIKGFQLKPSRARPSSISRSYLGRRAPTITSQDRGRGVRYQPTKSKSFFNLAFIPTLISSFLNHGFPSMGRGLKIEPGDLRSWFRQYRAPMTIVLVVDVSSSTSNFIPAVANALALVYRDAYRKKDKLGLIAFQENYAVIHNHPTNNFRSVLGNLTRLTPSGFTPLAKGLEKCLWMLREEKKRNREMIGSAVLVSDCHPEPLTHQYEDLMDEPAYQQTLRIAQRFVQEKIPLVVINPSHGMLKGGKLRPGAMLGMKLAKATGGRYFGVPEGDIPHKEELLGGLAYKFYLRDEAKKIASVFEEFRIQSLSKI